jgi:hypothetical protein
MFGANLMSVAIIHHCENLPDTVSALVFDTDTESAIDAFMFSVGYRKWEYTIRKDLNPDKLADQKIWFKNVDISFGIARIKI